ncbi:hypothetical protein BGZ54_009844 [Gamsiella multidivaricata]|nr:hypothetical protein BGZ54_009844 [Gamsiella multidivaricata]
MPFSLQVIADVDENSLSARGFLLGARDISSSSRPVVYISREHCIQHKLRNAVVALTLPGAPSKCPPVYASVKIYSKESKLFRHDPRFPEKLGVEVIGNGSTTPWPVVVSSLLWCAISRIQYHTSRVPEEFRGDVSMSAGQEPVEVVMDVIAKLGNATMITLEIEGSNSDILAMPNPASIAQSLSGFIASRLGWIVFKSPHGTQTFRITQITTNGSDHANVALISGGTCMRYASPVGELATSSVAVLGSGTLGLLSKEDWIAAVRCVIGGYDDILREIIDHIYGYIEDAVHGSSNSSVAKPDSCFQAPFKGVLISGHPGTGKSALASSLAEYSGLPFTVINCPDVFQTGVEAKLFATLLHLVDLINTNPSGNKVFIVGEIHLSLTNRLHAVDQSLVRSGRLDKVFDLHLKGARQRLEVLDIVAKDLPMDPGQRPEILLQVSKATHGFVPTDLQSVCTESALLLISRMTAGVKNNMVDYSYFEKALKTIRPSGMSEFQSKIPVVTFDDLFGIEDAIADLRMSIIEPFHNPGKYINIGIAPPRGLLIYGPPGVGKTMLCCALAEELGINFMLVESSQIRSKVVGESEQNIARMFSQAKANAPCILFIDQIDVLAPSRGSTHTSENSGYRIVTGLLTATNRPEVIDSAILRPGRLDQIVHIPVPDHKTRHSILRGYTAKMPLNISSDEMQELAANTEGYSGADLEGLCREAALICLREDIKNTEITIEHLQAAKQVSKPSLLGYKDKHIFTR